MKVFLCTHNTGGVGKTTLAVHFAGVLAEEGKVLLIDCDSQADAWEFYTGEGPKKSKDFAIHRGISILTNQERTSIKRLVKLTSYNYIILDMDTLLENIVQIVLGSDPNHIFIPANVSQKYKALQKNLQNTLEVVANLEGKAAFPPEVTIVPLGIESSTVEQILRDIPRKPSQCSVSVAMDNLQDPMQEAVYRDRSYIWELPGYEHLKNYFVSLLDV